MTAFFVTGSGTEIGKTYVSAALLCAMRRNNKSVRAVKPLMSGFSRDRLDKSDAGQLLSACGRYASEEAVADICLHAFEAPFAPNVAARKAGVALNDGRLLDFIRVRIADPDIFTLIEGAGGVMSPATDTMLQIDLIEALGLPAIFVAAAYLGAVSHSLTALEALDRRRIAVRAIVVTQPAPAGAGPGVLIAELARWREEPFITVPFGADPALFGLEIARLLTAPTSWPAPDYPQSDES